MATSHEGDKAVGIRDLTIRCLPHAVVLGEGIPGTMVVRIARLGPWHHRGLKVLDELRIVGEEFEFRLVGSGDLADGVDDDVETPERQERRSIVAKDDGLGARMRVAQHPGTDTETSHALTIGFRVCRTKIGRLHGRATPLHREHIACHEGRLDELTDNLGSLLGFLLELLDLLLFRAHLITETSHVGFEAGDFACRSRIDDGDHLHRRIDRRPDHNGAQSDRHHNHDKLPVVSNPRQHVVPKDVAYDIHETRYRPW